MKSYILFGVQRSGNHGIINLILKSNNKNYVHINNSVLNYNLFNKFSQIEIKNRTNKKGQFIGFKDAEMIILSLENKVIDYTELEKFIDSKCILLLRNPYNNFASLFKSYENKKLGINRKIKSINFLKKIWKSYAKNILDNNNIIIIIYDLFYKDSNYRNSIFNKLELQYDEKYLYEISGNGISSFERKNNNASKLNIFSRYEKFLDNELYINLIINDIELRNLWNQIKKKFNFTTNDP